MRRVLKYTFLISVTLICVLFSAVQQRAFWPRFSPHPFHSVEVDNHPGSPSLGTTVFGDDSKFSYLQKLGYRFALAKFPDEAACIKNNHEGVPSLNWDDIRSLKQLDVCVFNIAHARQNREVTLVWFKAAGMNAGVRDVLYRRNDLTYFKDIKRRYLNVTVTKIINRHPVLFPVQYLLHARRSIHVDFSEDGSVNYIKQEVSAK